jgi:hypothetical protein
MSALLGLPVNAERALPPVVLDPEVVSDREHSLAHLITTRVTAAPERLALLAPVLPAVP